MKTIDLRHIKLEIDVELTERFYASQNGFVCDCPDCTNYVSNIPNVQKSLGGLDKQLGIDLHKAVGQGIDELMPHDYDDSHLDVIPYYAIGRCYLNEKWLEQQYELRANKKLTDDLSLSIVNTSGQIEMKGAENILTVWLEYRTKMEKK